jgi:hypothetical protein
MAGAIGALAWEVSNLFNSPNLGGFVIALLTAFAAAGFYVAAKRFNPVTAADLDRTGSHAPTPAPAGPVTAVGA